MGLWQPLQVIEGEIHNLLQLYILLSGICEWTFY